MPYLAQQRGVSVQFLIQSFNVFGVEVQTWMLIVIILVIGFIFFIRTTRNRS
jgi:hypothetical protein